jgi:hypothetical protein
MAFIIYRIYRYRTKMFFSALLRRVGPVFGDKFGIDRCPRLSKHLSVLRLGSKRRSILKGALIKAEAVLEFGDEENVRDLGRDKLMAIKISSR